jgi:CRP/FNR family transcriptional regulator, cyclic AMP receptor protein
MNVPSSLFSNLSEDQQNVIMQHTLIRRYPKNAVIITESDTPDCLYFIKTGKVKVFLSNEEGKEIVINTLKEGDYFGELSLIDGAERSASVMTTEASTFYVLIKASFEKILKEHPDIALALIRDLVKTVRNLTDNVKSFALKDVYGRLTDTLIKMSEEREGKTVILEKITQSELAKRVGASREMVSKIFNDLVEGGYISVSGKSVYINQRFPKSY